MSIVQTTDFVGEYKISQSRFSDLDTYISNYEEFYLLRLLGADLYDLFIADLTSTTPQVPQTAIYLAIFNKFHTDNNGSFEVSEGIKKMLMQFIYFHYVRDQQTYNSTAGTVVNDNENSQQKLFSGPLVDHYNKGVNNYKTIVNYILDNPNDYPEYNGINIYYASGI